MVDTAVGAAVSAYEDAEKTSADAAPAVGCVNAPAGYAAKADVAPVTLHCDPAQPAPNVHADVHAGQAVASPKVDATLPTAVHAAVVTSVHELAPACELEPGGHGIAALEPSGHMEPAGHAFVVPTACPAAQKKPAGQTNCIFDGSVLAGQK